MDLTDYYVPDASTPSVLCDVDYCAFWTACEDEGQEERSHVNRTALGLASTIVLFMLSVLSVISMCVIQSSECLTL